MKYPKALLPTNTPDRVVFGAIIVIGVACVALWGGLAVGWW